MKNIFLYVIFILNLISWPLVLSAQENAAIVYFRAGVDKLRLRAAPDKNAAVLAELKEHTMLRYLNESGGNMEQLTLRGVQYNKRWYKVAVADDLSKSGWVYGGAVAISSVFIPENISFDAIQEDFLKISKSSKAEFEKVKTAAQNVFTRDTLAHCPEAGVIRLDYENGNGRIIRDTIDAKFDGEGSIAYEYLGQYESIAQYLIKINGSEFQALQFISSRNGKLLETMPFTNNIPVLSPDKKWLALGHGDVYENRGGLQFLLSDANGVFLAFTIEQEDADVTDCYWSESSGELFFVLDKISREYGVPPSNLRYYRLKIPAP